MVFHGYIGFMKYFKTRKNKLLRYTTKTFIGEHTYEHKKQKEQKENKPFGSARTREDQHCREASAYFATEHR